MANPLSLVTGQALPWVFGTALVIVAGLGISQYIRAEAAEKRLAACAETRATQAGQIEVQNKSLDAAKRAADAVRSDADKLVAAARERAASDAQRIVDLQARVRNPGAKTCTDALREIRAGWKARP